MADYDFKLVNYTYYSSNLGRAVVPTEGDFNELKLENVLQMQQYIDDGLVTEKITNGIDSAVCLWIEEDYKALQLATGNAGVIQSSETIGSYSHSNNTKAYDEYIARNSESIARKKYKWLSLYCNVTTARG